jgi:hypothetical protein
MYNAYALIPCLVAAWLNLDVVKLIYFGFVLGAPTDTKGATTIVPDLNGEYTLYRAMLAPCFLGYALAGKAATPSLASIPKSQVGLARKIWALIACGKVPWK